MRSTAAAPDRRWRWRLSVAALVAALASQAAWAVAPGKVFIIVAARSRGGGLHEHRATAELLARLLRDSAGAPIRTEVIDGANAGAPGALRAARAIVLLGDEGDAHLLKNTGVRRNVAELVERGGGLVLLHGSAVGDGALERDLVAWTGGVVHSEHAVPAVNWPAGFGTMPAHPTLAGQSPFSVNDRWLPARHLEQGATPLLQAEAPEYAQLGGPGRQTLAWAFERPGAGRALVYGGGHFFEAYGAPELQRFLTTAIRWTAKVTEK